MASLHRIERLPGFARLRAFEVDGGHFQRLAGPIRNRGFYFHAFTFSRALFRIVLAWSSRSALASRLRYQLLHRAAAAMFESERCKAKQAMVLIHSFAQKGEDFADYNKFLEKLGIAADGDSGITASRKIHGIELRFGWVADQPKP